MPELESGDDDEWYDELSEDEVDKVYQHVAQAKGAVKSALETLDGRGGEHRDELAAAYHTLNIEKMSFDGARKQASERGDE